MRNLGFHLLYIMVMMLISCNQQSNNKVQKEHAPVVDVFRVKDTIVSTIFEYSGTLEAFKRADVGSSLPGKIEEIYVHKGQPVKKGQPLVRLSSEVLILSEVEYQTLQKDFERVSRLRERGSISEQEFDHIKAKYDAAKAKYEFFLNSTLIKAPFDGVVAEIFMNEGEMYSFIPTIDQNLTVGRGIVRLVQTNPLRAIFHVHESRLSAVAIGHRVTVKIDQSDRIFEGKVIYISPEINTSTHTARVEVQVSDPGGTLMPGMFCRIYMQSKPEAGCVVPLSAIIQKDDRDYVWLVEDETVRLVPVQRVGFAEEYVFVKGIQAGQFVVVSKKMHLQDGMNIRMQPVNQDQL